MRSRTPARRLRRAPLPGPVASEPPRGRPLTLVPSPTAKRAARRGRVIEPAVEPPWTEYIAAAERLASHVAIDRWPAAVSAEELLVLLLAVDRLIARASRRGADEQIGVLRAWKDLVVELHRVRGEADRRAEQRTKPLAAGRSRAVGAAAGELEAIRREIDTIRRREGCKEKPAIRRYLQQQHPKRRQPQDRAVDALARRLSRARTRKKKPDTTT